MTIRFPALPLAAFVAILAGCAAPPKTPPALDAQVTVARFEDLDFKPLEIAKPVDVALTKGAPVIARPPIDRTRTAIRINPVMSAPTQPNPSPYAAVDLDAMRTGLQAGEFFLEYMPTVSLVDGRCIGSEALVRWRRPDGVVSPADFIPAAENTPLSGLITYWVIDKLAEEMGDWLRANAHAHLSINVPPEILGRGGMEYVATKAGLIDLARQLILEITERGVPDPMGVDALNNLWGVRVRVALDDVTFVGGANLAVLARCPFDFIKLDRSLVAQIQPGAPAPAWLDGIASMLRTSSMTVIAEGVETDAQLAALRAIGMPAAQGFLFARPMPALHFFDYHRKMQRV